MGGLLGWNVEDVGGVASHGLAWEADAREALGGGEDGAAVGVVPGISLVLAQDGELDAVDCEELVEGQVEGLGGEDVDLDQGLAPGKVGAERDVAVPCRGQPGEEGRREAGVGTCPGVGLERVDMLSRRVMGEGGSAELLPQFRVVDCQAGQAQSACAECGADG